MVRRLLLALTMGALATWVLAPVAAAGAPERFTESFEGTNFAPAGELVPVALTGLERGGTLAIAGIHLSDVPFLNYQEHLFMERQVRSVTANTRSDGEEFLALAARLGLEVTTSSYELGAADRALEDLAADRVTGAAVLVT